MPRTQAEKLWWAGAAFAAALMVVIGYLALIRPQQHETDRVHAEVAAQRTQTTALQARVAALEQQSKHLASYEAQLAQARLALPSTSGLPDFLRTLQETGNQTLARVSSLSVAAPTDVTRIVTSPSPTATASASPSKSGEQAPSVAGAHVYALPISAQVTGTVAQLSAFLTQLQSVQPRAVLISALSLGSGKAGTGEEKADRVSVLSLTMQAFVAPDSAAEQARLSAASHP